MSSANVNMWQYSAIMASAASYIGESVSAKAAGGSHPRSVAAKTDGGES